jgi:hypothetical protein
LSWVIAAVFSGAVFGDHCSPLSDTTIVASISCAVEPLEHVRTQLPYALIAAVLAMWQGFLPTGLGIHPLAGAGVGILCLLLITRFSSNCPGDPMIETIDFRHIARINIRRFILFRMLFNARFYYPVFAVIFLDFGLSLEQFALLNAIWAATIILAEVPSGAISDLLGRKRLLVLTATLMVLEMAVWAFAPTSNPSLLFWMLVGNRILSGLGEAAASGSDEALVFDSLEAAGMQDEWPKVLERVSRWQSFAFVVTMITGALVYDPRVMGLLVEGWWPEWTWTRTLPCDCPCCSHC